MNLNKLAATLGTLCAAVFLIGLAATLTKSRLIGFYDIEDCTLTIFQLNVNNIHSIF